jgi:hypothetical protein
VRVLPPGWLIVAFALASLLVASCTDDVTANCPPLAHPEVLTVAAASNPCAGRATATLTPRPIVATLPRPAMQGSR